MYTIGQFINLWFIPFLHALCYADGGGDSVEKLEFHLINIKTGEVEPEVALVAERDENGEITSFKSVDREN